MYALSDFTVYTPPSGLSPDGYYYQDRSPDRDRSYKSMAKRTYYYPKMWILPIKYYLIFAGLK